MMQIVLQQCLRLVIALFATVATLHIAIPTEIWAVNAAEFVTQSNSEGMVTIKVTPQALSTSSTALRFEVILETHTVGLTQDQREAAVLSDGVGNEYKPIAWDGDPPGGHHRKGVLVFAPISPAPTSFILKIRDVAGVPERVFTWTIPPSRT